MGLSRCCHQHQRAAAREEGLVRDGTTVAEDKRVGAGQIERAADGGVVA